MSEDSLLLQGIALYCTVLYCTVLYCTVQVSEDSLLLQGIAARDFGHIHYTDQEVCLAVLLGRGHQVDLINTCNVRTVYLLRHGQ